MMKKYVAARKDILDERDTFSAEEKATKYACNGNYIYEPFKKDTDAISRLRAQG